MNAHQSLSGIYAAALTPLRADYSPALADIPLMLDFLARRGCHGALLLGTTGEGTSFAPDERLSIWRAAKEIRQVRPEFHLLAGTGTPSLEETIQLTRDAFEIGLDGVVVLPPYYYTNIPEAGLFAWFDQVLKRAVPLGGALFAYHIPPITGISFSLDLLSRLKDAHPERFAGLKDSSAKPEHAIQLGKRFGRDLVVLNGNDRLFSLALDNHASGCITALANLRSPDLRKVWDAYQQGTTDSTAQERLAMARGLMDRYPPAPPLLKMLINRLYDLPRWAIRPPLLPLDDETEKQVLNEIPWDITLV